MKKNILRYFLLFSLLSTLGFGCRGLSEEVQQAIQPVVLEYWRVLDGGDDMRPLIEAYQALHPNVEIRYRKFRMEEFEKELTNALAEDRGPDLFSVHNTWMRRYLPKLVALPKTLQIPYQTIKGKYRQEIQVDVRTEKTITPKQMKGVFVRAVPHDALFPTTEGSETREALFGLPLSIDTLALFYNKDLLDRAGIALPPTTWEEFQDHVQQLTKMNSEGVILQSGAALGTPYNVNRAIDVLSMLMMQNGTKMTNDGGGIMFHRTPDNLTGRAIPPGAEALRFYTDFATPTKEVYTWNASLPNSIDAFARGTTAFMFGYSYHVPMIKAIAPKLNFDITSVPQLNAQQPANAANYWLEVVSKKSKNQNFAWDFIQFATSVGQVEKYLDTTGKPPALRSLIESRAEKQEELAPFIKATLYADSWYPGSDPETAEKIFLEMIQNALTNGPVKGDAAFIEAIERAAGRMGQT